MTQRVELLVRRVMRQLRCRVWVMPKQDIVQNLEMETPPYWSFSDVQAFSRLLPADVIVWIRAFRRDDRVRLRAERFCAPFSADSVVVDEANGDDVSSPARVLVTRITPQVLCAGISTSR